MKKNKHAIDDLIGIKEAAQILEKSIQTLKIWDEKKKLSPIANTDFGGRIYSKKEVMKVKKELK
jgi:DNA-binding transcriptional MerR regulator